MQKADGSPSISSPRADFSWLLERGRDGQMGDSHPDATKVDPRRSVLPEITSDGVTHIACEVSEGHVELSEQTRRLAEALGVSPHTSAGEASRRFQVAAVPPKLLRRLAEAEAEQRMQRMTSDVPGVVIQSGRPVRIETRPRLVRWAFASAAGAAIGCVVTLGAFHHDNTAAAAPTPSVEAVSCRTTPNPFENQCPSPASRISPVELVNELPAKVNDGASRVRRGPIATQASPKRNVPGVSQGNGAVDPESAHAQGNIVIPTGLHPRMNPLLTSEQVFER